MIASVISVLLSCAVGTLVGRKLSRDPYRQNVCVYSINMPNTGYVGTPLVLALFGSEVLMQMGLFCLPFSIYTYTEGYRLLLDRKGFSFPQPSQSLAPRNFRRNSFRDVPYPASRGGGGGF